jgi:pimeloyl-ACP methyl ester carboxylesterase
VGITILIGFLAYIAIAVGMQRGMMYPAPPPPRESAVDQRADVESIWLGAQENIEAWFLPAARSPNMAAPDEKTSDDKVGLLSPALIFTHGNGELIDYWLEPFEILRNSGLSVLLLEYPGYGRSGGKPTQESITSAAAAAYDYLVSRDDIDNSRIVAYGRSLGGGAACALAVQRELAGLILESSFSGVKSLARRMAIPGFLVLDPFDNLSCLANYDGPVLIMHGNWDQIIPASHARELDAAAANSELVLMACGHNDCARPWGHIKQFLHKHSIVELDPLSN